MRVLLRNVDGSYLTRHNIDDELSFTRNRQLAYVYDIRVGEVEEQIASLKRLYGWSLVSEPLHPPSLTPSSHEGKQREDQAHGRILC
jgi:hypothetical protein